MSDQEKSGEGFLERWSRKKIEAEREPAAPEPDERAEDEAALKPTTLRQDAGVASKPSPPGFDLSKLPSLDSITGSTDIRGFLAPGVPKELARAALRRAWAADPAIRDFKGLAENDWDFTDPAAMPGFGNLPDGYDVKKMVAQVFGQGGAPAPEAVEPSPSDQIASQTEPPEPAGSEPERRPDSVEAPIQVADAEIVQRESIAASHNSVSDDAVDQPKLPRQHGGALPK